MATVRLSTDGRAKGAGPLAAAPASAPERVWWALSTDAGRAKFWAERTVRRGDLIEWVFPNDMRTSGRIWAEQPCGLLELDYFGARTAFLLCPDGQGGTELELDN